MRLLTLPELKTCKGVPYSRQHVYRLVASGQFPRPLRLSENRIAFVESEVDEWIEQARTARDEAA